MPKIQDKLAEIDYLRTILRERQEVAPLTLGELERYREDFIISNTYNSNAIEGNNSCASLAFANHFTMSITALRQGVNGEKNNSTIR